MADAVKEDVHPSQETARRFPQDCRLRRWGFRIHARPKGDEAVWRWVGNDRTDGDGELYGMLEALQLTYRLEKEQT